ncbi:MAG TPA: methyltransferase domain-containing protein [Syntrophorhabdaceae bacterium]|nr:methyltransferase domain-containing protein [Syntrophorhabdaceae bacterium]
MKDGGTGHSVDKSARRLDKYRAVHGKTDPDYHYKGLAIYALTGLHEHVTEQILLYFQPGDSILELGAGSGAMSLRLIELGFQVTAVDILAESFDRHGTIPFKAIDLNGSFSQEFTAHFDGIVAVEIVEHLENPWNFLRECRNLLSPGGRLLMTTPNVDNPVSKALFVRQGSFMWFNDYNYETDGHITPITQWQLYKIISEHGMKVVSITSFGDPYVSAKKEWKKLYILAKGIEKLYNKKNALLGEILVLVLSV